MTPPSSFHSLSTPSYSYYTPLVLHKRVRRMEFPL